jgi:hypothetical protein
MRGLSYRGVIHAQVVSDRANNDFTGVESYSDGYGNTLGPPELGTIATHCLLHAQGCITRTLGVVFVGQWCPKRGHDSIAHHVVDSALVSVNSLHHPLHHSIEQSSGFLRVAVGQEFHRALQICEENGYLLAFAFEGALRGSDLLGKVLRCIRIRRGWGRLGNRRTVRGLTTLEAEFCVCRKLGRTLRAGDVETITTLQTEFSL